MQTQAPDSYKTLHFLVKHGDAGALVVALTVLLSGLGAAVMTGAYWAIPLAVLGCALVYLLARSYVELVRVIVDMLLPK